MRTPKPKRRSTPLQVLVLDDDRVDRHRLARLCSGLPLATTLTNAIYLSEFADQLKSQSFDLILVDYYLLDGTGLDALELIRLSQTNVNAAVLMISGQADDTIAKAALAAGCADYITKDELSASTFHRAVTNALQKLNLNIQIESQTFRRTEVEKVLEKFAIQCAHDVKPMLSRMMRQIRHLRATDIARDPGMPNRYAAIEDSCTSMWEFLVALEQHHDTDLIPEAPLPNAGMVSRAARRQPPSPFARLGN